MRLFYILLTILLSIFSCSKQENEIPQYNMEKHIDYSNSVNPFDSVGNSVLASSFAYDVMK